jgi:hypothetical protein
MAAGTYPVSVAGVGSLMFTLNNGTLSVSPNPLALQPVNTMNVTLDLPATAPPGGVRLALSVVPSNLAQLSSPLLISSYVGRQHFGVTSQRLGSGTIQVSGAGYNTLSLPLTSEFGAARCRAVPNAGGGVDLRDLATDQVLRNLPATATPGRVATCPSGRRAVAQYSTGVSVIDLVNCSDLGFLSATTPFIHLACSDDDQYLAADWNNNGVGSGITGFELVGDHLPPPQVFSDTSTVASQNVVVKSDGSGGTFAFWVTSDQGRLSLSSYSFTSSHSCSWGNIPSTVDANQISFSGGIATITFPQGSTLQSLSKNPETCR